MADKTAQIKVTIKNDAAKAGIKGIEDETKRAAGGMKAALSSAMTDGMKAGKEAFSGLLSNVKSAVGTIGGLMGGVGLAELVQGGLEANAKITGLTFSLKAAGGSARDAVGVMHQLRIASLETAQDSMKMVDVFEGIRGETGSIDFATDSIEDVATAARGAHKPLEAMGNIAGTLNEKFGIAAGDDLKDTLADVVGLSEKGGIQFDDMANKLGLIGAYAKEAGLSGREGFGSIVGLLNIADNSTGTFKKGLTAVGGLLEQLGTTAGKNKIGAALGISGGAMKGDAISQIEAIMKATKGQKGQLEKAFGGEQLKLLVDMGKTYSAALDATAGDAKTKQAAAAAALHATLTDASKSAVTWSTIQNEAAAQMKEAPQQIAVATEKLRQAFQSEKFQHALASVIDRLPALAEWLAKIAGWTIDNPGTAISAAILASIGKAAIGEAVGSALGSLFKAFPGATIGVGLLAAAAVAAAEAIADYEKKAHGKEEELDATPALIKKAQQEIKATGSVSEDTLNDLAKRRSEFEAVKKAGETGGVTGMSYAAILAAKITGGADDVAAGEGVTKEANKLGPEGVASTIADLDATLQAAIAAKRGAAPAGPPVPPGADPFAPGFAAPTPSGAGVPASAGAAPAAAPGGGGGGGGGGSQPADPAIFQAAFKGALATQLVKVHVANAADIGGGNMPSGVGPVKPGYAPR